MVLPVSFGLIIGCSGNDSPQSASSGSQKQELKSSASPSSAGEEEASSSKSQPPAAPSDSAADDQAEADQKQGLWGDLAGRFVFDGSIPEPEVIEIVRDLEFCGPHRPVDEAVIVHRENRGLANVVVRLETKSSEPVPAIHESYAASAESKIPLDNQGCRFTPRVCLLRTTQTLVISNNDEISHNTAAYLDRNDPFNELTAMHQSIERRFKRPERMPPAKVNCSIHPWMSGWLVVSDHPYAAVSDENGHFTIKHLPVGEWTFQIWQEKAGWITAGMRDGQPVEWKRGRVTLTIQPSENQLGEIHLSPEAFAGDQ